MVLHGNHRKRFVIEWVFGDDFLRKERMSFSVLVMSRIQKPEVQNMFMSLDSKAPLVRADAF